MLSRQKENVYRNECTRTWPVVLIVVVNEMSNTNILCTHKETRK